MAKASTILKKHLSLISEMEKAAQPDTVKNPQLKTKTEAAKKKASVESRIAELEQQRAAFNKKMDEAIAREKKQRAEIERLEKLIEAPTPPKTDDKPNPRSPGRAKANMDAGKAPVEKRKGSPAAAKRRPAKK
ncbi:hypothetical protein O1O06_07575 [Grimontia hollisae]|uniref:hypothetical protein n=1 Tax=Grimontia hollisae TaxID=673 RepID=UPI0013030119|nr:hypothetical protein [Grimontia hollisae]MDF2184624.1 hypothetical protein [Grimontia hollisae]